MAEPSRKEAPERSADSSCLVRSSITGPSGVVGVAEGRTWFCRSGPNFVKCSMFRKILPVFYWRCSGCLVRFVHAGDPWKPHRLKALSGHDYSWKVLMNRASYEISEISFCAASSSLRNGSCPRTGSISAESMSHLRTLTPSSVAVISIIDDDERSEHLPTGDAWVYLSPHLFRWVVLYELSLRRQLMVYRGVV